MKPWSKVPNSAILAGRSERLRTTRKATAVEVLAEVFALHETGELKALSLTKFAASLGWNKATLKKLLESYASHLKAEMPCPVSDRPLPNWLTGILETSPLVTSQPRPEPDRNLTGTRPLTRASSSEKEKETETENTLVWVPDERLQKLWVLMTQGRRQVVTYTESREKKLRGMQRRFGWEKLELYAQFCDSNLDRAVFLREQCNVSALLKPTKVQERLDMMVDGVHLRVVKPQRPQDRSFYDVWKESQEKSC